MTGDQPTRTAAAVLVAALVLGVLGAGVATAGAAETATRAGATSPAAGSAPTVVVGPTPANHSAIEQVGSDTLNESWADLTAANRTLANASAELDTVSAGINESGTYSEDDHGEAETALRQMDNETAELNRAANESVAAVNASGAAPARKFQALAAIESQRRAGEQRAEASVDSYQSAVRGQRASVESTVTVRLGGGLVVGLFLGVLLGAVVPVREARNVEEQLKLSRNVEYNRRAALIPIAVGLALFLCGVGLSWLLGAVDLIGVIV